jgi:hypothetical protein
MQRMTTHLRPRRVALLLAAVAATGLVACSGSPAAPAARSTPSAHSTSGRAASAPATVWLCRPGHSPDPCTFAERAVTVDAAGRTQPDPAPSADQRDLDCFYVYPTVSTETTANADLTIQKAEDDVAVAQASRFSSVCRVWAPMYRQRTLTDLFNLAHAAPDSPQNLLALSSLRSAWHDYLAHDNHGRRVVLIGHSQGAAMLIRLIRSDIDSDPAMRAKVALAILLGGNVTVLPGRTVGGSFQHIPLCTRRGESGCVIAYSSFLTPPSAGGLFGTAGTGVSLQSGETARDREVACVNPADFSAAPAPLRPYFPSVRLTAGAHWATYPGRYVAQCRSANGVTWLQVTPHAPDARPLVTEDPGPSWGLHRVDVNLALGDLVAAVAALP